MAASFSLMYLWLIICLFFTTNAHVHVLQDGETWTDDYRVDENGIDGWRYLSATRRPIIGSDRTYHGWFYLLYNQASLGYFYRSFQCEYDSLINVSFSAYFGCDYDATGSFPDGVILYLNRYEFTHEIRDERIDNYTDAVAIHQSMLCSDNYHRGTFIGFTSTQSLEIKAYSTVDVGFRMTNLYSSLTQEFGAISDIKIQCNKLNTSQLSPPQQVTDIPVMNITHPSQHITCSTSNQSTCAQSPFCEWDQYHQNRCSCGESEAVDIVFGIGITSVFESNEMKRWLLDDIITNIDTARSRFGLILFDENVTVPIDIDTHYNRETLTSHINRISWPRGYLNYAQFFMTAMEQFNSVAPQSNDRILVIVTDNNPDTPQTNGAESIVCQYRSLLASAAIRVIVVVIDRLGNQPRIENYKCITQYSFDLILVHDYVTGITAIEYDMLHTATHTLSASLCPELLSTDAPTIKPTIQPSMATTTTTTTAQPTRREDKVDFTVKTAANATNSTRALVAVIANITGLDSTQISVISTPEGWYISIVGSNDEIDVAEGRVHDIEEGIEEITGFDAEVTHIHRTYGDAGNGSEGDTELKRLLIYLIIAVSVLICVVIVISGVCCYCLFIKKNDHETKNDADKNSKQTHVSVPSKTLTQVTHNHHKQINICEATELHSDMHRGHHLHNYSGTANSLQKAYVHMIGGSVHRLTIDSVVSDAPEAHDDMHAVDLSVIVGSNEAEVNKLYLNESEPFQLHKQQTCTQTGEGMTHPTCHVSDGDDGDDDDDDDDDDDAYDDMYIEPDPNKVTPCFNAQPSYDMIHQKSFNLITPMHSAQNTMNINEDDLNELSQNLPLPSEEEEAIHGSDDNDNDVVKDMTHGECPGTGGGNDDLYGRGDGCNEEEFESSDDDHEGMYDINNRTKISNNDDD